MKLKCWNRSPWKRRHISTNHSMEHGTTMTMLMVVQDLGHVLGGWVGVAITSTNKAYGCQHTPYGQPNSKISLYSACAWENRSLKLGSTVPSRVTPLLILDIRMNTHGTPLTPRCRFPQHTPSESSCTIESVLSLSVYVITYQRRISLAFRQHRAMRVLEIALLVSFRFFSHVYRTIKMGGRCLICT